MNITINDVPLTLPSGSMLSDALAAIEIKLSGIATALNGTVIPADRRQSTPLSEGDKIVIIKAFYGG